MLAAVALVLGVAAVKLLPVRYVRIEGELRKVEPAALQAALEPLLEAGYLRVDINAVDAAVRNLPWVGDVTVTRLWPETLVVRISEMTPYARCEDGSLISEKGVRFRAAETEETARLPLIHGPEGHEKPMLAMLKTMNAKLAPLGRRIAVLHLSNRHAWTVKLEDGLVVAMGRQDALAAFDRFLTLATLLGAERLQAVQRVDLRYPNGCAVSMKPKAELKLGGLDAGANESWQGVDPMKKSKA
ncbi:hypothetical protein MoryE10_28430 [Methylogaea oryzae]|uniref:Cell division protein FtsQ n=1 Tax=Methylogaea oryzae TaxID=1295382 RepID=A0A8D4VTC7_9GAMM|nr:hypothetical protein MoryE10_28430 [Methylogaea oryzae]